MTEPDSPAQPSATNEEYEFADEEKGPAEDGTGTLRRRRAHDIGKHGSSGILDEDDSDVKDAILARDREVCESLLEEEQQSFARIKDGHKESRLPENTTSFIIAAPICSYPFSLGAAVIILKLMLYGLALVNTSIKRNPISVSPEVRITQVLAMVVASFTQRDVENTVQFVYEGYASVEGHFDGDITLWGWRTAVFVALLQGALGLVTIFVMIGVSRNVLDVLLNFAAVAMVMKLDVTAFRLASLGFLGESCQFQTEKVSGTYFRVGHSPKVGYTGKTLFLIAIFLVMFSGWLTIFIFQQQGRWSPQHLVVQFADDSTFPKLGTFSGIYNLHGTKQLRQYGRFHWKQEDSTQGDILESSFCEDGRRWSFFLNGADSRCKDSIVDSSPTAEEYDPSLATDRPWFVRDQDRSIPMHGFTIAPICVLGGRACGQKSKSNTCQHVKRSYWQFANAGVCKCQDQQTYGVRCEFSLANICLRLNIDSRFGLLPAARRLTSEFNLLSKEGTVRGGNETPASRDDLVLLYQRPVYVGSSFGQDGYDVLFYTGLRWAVTGSLHGFPKLHRNKASVTDQELATFLQGLSKGFNAGFNGTVAQVDVLSEPVSIASLEDNGTPVGLTWVSLEQADSMERVKLLNEISLASLLCAGCDDLTNPCQHEGRCNTTSQTCECKHGAKGVLCQVQPTGDGSCNSFFNTPKFNYDGGDCCESTCSPSLYHCGTINDGDLDETINLRRENNFVDMGFQKCSDPAIVDNCNENRCWAKGSEFPTMGTPHETDENIFSANGQMLLVLRRSKRFLAVFDKDSRGQWVQRGPNILSIFPPFDIGVGADGHNSDLVNFITLPSAMYGNGERSHLPVWVVFTTPGVPVYTRFVEWDLQSRSWKEYALPLDLRGCVGLDLSRSTSYLDLQLVLQASHHTVSDGETSCLYTANITTDGQRYFTLSRIINGADSEGNLGGVDYTDQVNNPIGVTMNEHLIMVWNRTTLRVIDHNKTEVKADVKLPENCSDGLQSVHLSGRSTRYRYKYRNIYRNVEGPRVALECRKNSSIFVYVFTINSRIASDTFMQQPFASLELLPVPTTEVVKSLAFSDSLLALAFSTNSATRVLVYNGTGFDYEGGYADEANFRLFGNTVPRSGSISVSDDGLSFFIDDSKDIEIYTTSPRCDSETQVSLILTLQTTSVTSDIPTFFTVQGRNANSNITWIESKGLSSGVSVEAGTILHNEFCINTYQLDQIRVVTRIWDVPFALLNRRPVTLNLFSNSSLYAYFFDISSEDVQAAINATQGSF